MKKKVFKPRTKIEDHEHSIESKMLKSIALRLIIKGTKNKINQAFMKWEMVTLGLSTCYSKF